MDLPNCHPQKELSNYEATSNPNALDYETFVSKMCVKETEIEKLGEAKCDAIRRFREKFQDFLQTQAEYEITKQKARVSRFSLKQEKAALKGLQEEQAAWDKLLEAKQKKLEEMKELNRKDSLEFKENCEKLYVKYEKFAVELNNETLLKEINKITSSKESLERAIEEVELEMQRVGEQPDCEFTKLPGLKELTETLERESVELYGRPHELKKKLKELQQNIDFLEEQIRKMENN